jgi:Na+/pantothenate symporter
MDIGFRFMSAFAPPIMIPLIFGLLFRRFHSRGVIAGVIAGALTGSLLVISNLILTQVYAEAIKTNAAVDFWLRSAWNSVATVANILATIAGLWFGSRKPAPDEEQARALEFFSELEKPFQSEEKNGKNWMLTFRIIPIALVTFGMILAGIATFVRVSYNDPRAFRMGLTVGLSFVALGIVLKLFLNKAERRSSE